MKNKKTLVLLAICLVVVVCFSLLGSASINASDEPIEEVKKQIVVGTGSPTRGDILVTGEYIGKVEPDQQVMVFAKLSGEVKAVHFHVGDSVEEGDVLAELDDKTLRTQISQTQAALGSAQAKAQQNLKIAEQNLETYQNNLGNGGNSALISAESAIANAENRLQTANASLSAARRKLRDHRELSEDEYIPGVAGADYDQATDYYRDMVVQAELACEAAQLGLEQAQAGFEATQIQVADQELSVRNSVESARLNTNFNDQYIALQKMQDDLKNAAVTAPISGIIEQCNVNAYDIASMQSPVFVISNKDRMVISFKVPEATLEHIRIGDEITVDKNGETWPGAVTEIATMADASGLYLIKASVQDAPFLLHTASTVKVYATAQKALSSVILPVDALYFESGQTYVYLAQDGVAKKQPVETGIYDATNVQILSGLSLSDQVILTWNAGLTDGAEIVLSTDLADKESNGSTEDTPSLAAQEPGSAEPEQSDISDADSEADPSHEEEETA